MLESFFGTLFGCVVTVGQSCCVCVGSTLFSGLSFFDFAELLPLCFLKLGGDFRAFISWLFELAFFLMTEAWRPHFSL
ncbi:hypothetical protein PHLH3_10200 [Pseudomonas sp. St386]|nr:hypothetical protein PHLH3_10200 [Pseudomonas sp. St386]